MKLALKSKENTFRGLAGEKLEMCSSTLQAPSLRRLLDIQVQNPHGQHASKYGDKRKMGGAMNLATC